MSRRKWTALLAVPLALGNAVALAQGTQPAGASASEQAVYDQYLRAYVEQIERMQQQAAQEQEPRVTIDMQNETIPNIAAEFARQGRVTILVDESTIDPERRFSFHVQNVPFRQALRAFMDMADLYFVEDSPTLIRLAQRYRMTISFDGDVRQLIELIAKNAGASVILHPQVSAQIKLTVADVPWDALLEYAVTTAGFALVREQIEGAVIYRVIPVAELQRQQTTQTFRLRYLQPPQQYRGQIKPNNYIEGGPSQFKQPQTTADWVKVFPVLSIVQSMMTKDARGNLIGDLQYEPESRTIVVTDTRPVLDRIRTTLEILDRMPATVLVDVRFVLTSNTDLFDFGIQWANAAGTGGLRIPTATFDPDVSPPSPFDPSPATSFPSTTVNRLPFGLGGRLDANWLTTLDLVATLNFFEGAQFTRVVQQPQVAALSGTEATIFSGETRRFAEAQVTTGSGGATTITFQEARSSPVNTGFQLMVIPFVPDSSDEVLLTIVPQLTDLIGFTTFGGGAGGGAGTLSTPIDLPQTASQTVVTRLRVRSGFTVVMGGLTSERQGITENRLPLLADIPIAGWLFKRRDLSDEHRRLLVMLTPYVVRGEQEEAENVRRALSQRGQQELGPLNVLRAESGVDALRDRIRRTQEQESRELERLRGEKP